MHGLPPLDGVSLVATTLQIKPFALETGSLACYCPASDEGGQMSAKFKKPAPIPDASTFADEGKK